MEEPSGISSYPINGHGSITHNFPRTEVQTIEQEKPKPQVSVKENKQEKKFEK